MAVIQKIRNKYGKIAGGVIALSLVAFILMDAASGRFGDLFGRDSSVVKVDGSKVDEKEYSKRLKDYEALYDIYSGGKTLDEATRAQLNEQAMNELINEKLVDEQCEKLGITVTPDEEKELIYGANADQMIQAFKIGGQDIFSNPETHHFDPQRVKLFEKQIKENDKTGKTQEGWDALKDYVIRNAKVTKFNNLVMGCVYTPKFLIDNMVNDSRQLANISFVKIPFTAINDAEVKVSDDDLNAYIKAHAAKYQVKEASRSIEFVSFDLIPMTDDTAKSLGELTKLKPAFDTVSTKNIESFVNRNSDDQYRDAFLGKKAFSPQYADSVYSKPVGGVYGPYYEAGTFKMAKVVDKKEVADSVKCRHILVKTKDRGNELRSDSAAKKRIDSAIAELKGGADFKTVALKYSDDSGSFAKGGEYEFTFNQKEGLSKEFGDFIFDGKKGESKTVHVENGQYAGYHYIEILDQKAFGPVAKLAIISKALEAGQQTDRTVFAKANEFAGKNTTGEAFDAAVKAGHLDKRNADNIKPESYTIQGLGSSREIIRWAYDHKVGEVSPVFNLDGKYIVAKVSAIQEKGLQTLNATNRPMIENAVKMEKKAELIKNKYKSMTSLEAIAQAAGQQPQEADSVAGNAGFIPKVGYAPKVVGYVFYKGLQPNAVSPGIQAGDGVYFIKLLNRWEKPVDPMANMMMGQQKMMMEMQSKNAMNNTLRDMLKNQATIKFTVSNI